MIQKITFTGADNQNSIKDLTSILESHDFVEFGILFSEKLLNTKRYPSLEYLNQLPTDLNFALHLCGNQLKQLVTNLDDSVFKDYPQLLKFKRIQLNFSPYKVHKQLPELLSKYENEFIYQICENDLKEELISNSKNVNFSVIFDSSGGNGIVPIWKELIKLDRKVGYAGGLGPDNLIEELIKIKQINTNPNIWIDMETKVRTNEMFDIDKVKVCIKQFVDFTSSQA